MTGVGRASRSLGAQGQAARVPGHGVTVRAALCSVLVVAASLVAGPHWTAAAQTEADRQNIDRQIESVQSQVQEASAEEARLLGEIDASAARKRSLDRAVADVDAELRAIERDLEAAESRLAAVEEEQRAAEARLTAAEVELLAAKERLAAYAVAAYTGRNDATRFVESLLRSQTIGELAAKRSYVRAVSTTQAEVIGAAERLRDEVADLRRRLASTRKHAQAQRDEVGARRAEVQSQRDAQARARSAVVSETRVTEGLRGQVVARKAEFEAEIAELQRQSALIAELLRRRAAESASLGNGPGAGGLLRPIPGAPVTSPFGPRVHPVYGDTRVHQGVDLGADSGTPIRAAGDGVVVSAEPFGGYGNATIIDHGGGVASLYAHQSSMGVSAGQRVTAGQVIGRVGCTGTCTGPHLHFEVRLRGTPVDPMPYIS